MKHSMYDTDILVVGSGIAGLSFALHVHEQQPQASITIVTKDSLSSSSSSLAQGGIAAVTDHKNDSFERHLEDTLTAGDGLCDPEVADFVVREASDRVIELSKWGIHFDKEAGGAHDLAKEGGHSARRILHAADRTGAQIMAKLIAAVRSIPQITVLEKHFAVDLICDQKNCCGIWLLPPGENKPRAVKARATMLATGGLGQVFLHTTNPAVATGDGIAMAYRAGAKISDMEFIQFHPTALWQEEPGTSFLISEAVRGAGAVLRNARGERFMSRYDPRLDLATRDIVARAVQNEMRGTVTPFVYLDCTKIPTSTFAAHFPTILEKCRESGIRPDTAYIPVGPAAHYCCGGIVTDQHGQSSIGSLYAAGECARTGLHGANRLASNSLSEALVFAKRSALHLARQLVSEVQGPRMPAKVPSPARYSDSPEANARLLRNKMSAASIIIREEPLSQATSLVKKLRSEFSHNQCDSYSQACLTYGNQLDAAWLILSAWSRRTTNAGAFFRPGNALLA